MLYLNCFAFVITSGHLFNSVRLRPFFLIMIAIKSILVDILNGELERF